MTVRAWLSRRPWIWVLLAFVLMVLANVALLVIAGRHPPVPV